MRVAGEKRNRDGLEGTLPEVRRNFIWKQNEMDGERKEVEVDERWRGRDLERLEKFLRVFDRVLGFMMKILKKR